MQIEDREKDHRWEFLWHYMILILISCGTQFVTICNSLNFEITYPEVILYGTKSNVSKKTKYWYPCNKLLLDLAFTPCWSLLLTPGNINGVRKVPARRGIIEEGHKIRLRTHKVTKWCIFDRNMLDMCECGRYSLYLRFFFRFILECIFGYAFESRIYIESFFRGSLKVRNVPFRCTPCFCLLLRNLTKRKKPNKTR